jgi:hypothetical protein
VVFTDPRWSSVKPLLQVEMIMDALILVAALPAASEFDPDKALTWVLGGGFVAILVGSLYLWTVMTARARKNSVPDQPAQPGTPGSSKTEGDWFGTMRYRDGGMP